MTELARFARSLTIAITLNSFNLPTTKYTVIKGAHTLMLTTVAMEV